MYTSWLALLIAPGAFVVAAPTVGHPSAAYRCIYGSPACCRTLNELSVVDSGLHGESFANNVAATGLATDALFLGIGCSPYSGVLDATLSAIVCPNTLEHFACCTNNDAGLGGSGCTL